MTDDSIVPAADPGGRRRPVRALREFDASNRYGLVLMLIALTYGVSAATTGAAGKLAIVFFQLASVWLILTVAGSRHVRRVAGVALLILGVAALVGIAIGASAVDLEFDASVYAVNALLYLLAPIIILISLVKRRTVDLQTFLGAISAYLLLGMMFAFTYRSLAEFQSTPFFGAAGDGTMSDDLFFSFITLTTTGYGNLVPAHNPGQTLAVVEAIGGQLFLVTAVAKVVTSWNPPRLVAGRAEIPDDGDQA